MTHRVLALASLLLVTSIVRAASPTIDAINPNATPAQSASVKIIHSHKDIGWYYTPTFDYNLDGIFTLFQAAGSVNSQTLTVQIQTERPVNGGTMLRQGTFVADRFGGTLGANFSPILLEGGTTYFVDFQNITGIGINVGTWENDQFGQPQPAGGATLNLGAYYYNSTSDINFPNVGAPYSQVTPSGFDTVNVAGGEPILFFKGTPVPEPSGFAMFIVGGAALLGRRR